MDKTLRSIKINYEEEAELISQLIYGETLVTNGLGGYSSTAICGATTRKYHGILVSAFPVLGRTVMLNYIEESVKLPNGKSYPLSIQENTNEKINFKGFSLKEFKLENGLPCWIYEIDGVKIEKKIFMVHQQNTVHLSYRQIDGNHPLELSLRPYFHIRHHESSVTTPGIFLQECNETGGLYEFKNSDLPPMYIGFNESCKYTEETKTLKNILYRIEAERGYDSAGDLSSPGYCTSVLEPNKEIFFTASTETLEDLKAISIPEAYVAEFLRREALLVNAFKITPQAESFHYTKELILAADQFIIVPVSRTADKAWAHAIGGDPRTIIAGYHWFTDWGRDTMISLEGLTLNTGRTHEADYILRTFAHHFRNGLIPNMFPDGKEEGTYITADATLWFFHALDRYYHYTKDQTIITDLLPKLLESIHFHIKGTDYGIHIDPKDGLLIQGCKHSALTWMDAKVGDFIVTPRRGKAVEINALWYNALQIAMEWLVKYDPNNPDLGLFQEMAAKCYESFNVKFWNEKDKCLYDIVEGENGNDDSCRPNQLFSISLKHPVLKEEYREPVIKTVREKLVTQYGLRTLSKESPNYKVFYHGNLFHRDSAYHQGTIWPWLIGPFIDAWLRVYPDKIGEAYGFLQDFNKHTSEGCLGTISEIFDAEKPFTHRGCIAQAWSVAEVFRSLCKIRSLL